MQFITRIRQSSQGTDQYGEPIYVTTETELQAAVGARTGSKTVGAAEVTITSGLTVYFAYETDIQNDDVFIYKGERFVLDGEKFDWENPFGLWRPGTVVDLQREING